MQGKLSEAKTALAPAIDATAARRETNEVLFAMGLRLQGMTHLFEGDTAQARTLIKQSSEILKKIAGTESSLYGANLWLESLVASAEGKYENAIWA